MEPQFPHAMEQAMGGNTHVVEDGGGGRAFAWGSAAREREGEEGKRERGRPVDGFFGLGPRSERRLELATWSP